MLKEFRQFIVRGNLVDLAVAVVLGAAFGTVVMALVKDLVTPLIAAVAGEPDFGEIGFTINGSRFAIGHFLNALVSFVLIAAVVFCGVVKPVNALLTRFQGLLFVLVVSVMSGTQEMVPAGGELTLFQAVGR